jgi:hypothetical protein
MLRILAVFAFGGVLCAQYRGPLHVVTPESNTGGAPGAVIWLEGRANGQQGVIVKAPASMGSNVNLVWPVTQPAAGSLIEVDGAGQMSGTADIWRLSVAQSFTAPKTGVNTQLFFTDATGASRLTFTGPTSGAAIRLSHGALGSEQEKANLTRFGMQVYDESYRLTRTSDNTTLGQLLFDGSGNPTLNLSRPTGAARIHASMWASPGSGFFDSYSDVVVPGVGLSYEVSARLGGGLVQARALYLSDRVLAPVYSRALTVPTAGTPFISWSLPETDAAGPLCSDGAGALSINTCGGGGAVTSVTGVGPITASPTTGAVVLGCPNCFDKSTANTLTGLTNISNNAIDFQNFFGVTTVRLNSVQLLVGNGVIAGTGAGISVSLSGIQLFNTSGTFTGSFTNAGTVNAIAYNANGLAGWNGICTGLDFMRVTNGVITGCSATGVF